MGDRGKDLWDEARVRKLPDGAEIVLGASAIATPAALDLAFARGIAVRHGRQAAEGVAPAAGNALWRKLLARDGTYVVEVRGGRPRVARLTESGPVPGGEH